MQMPFAKGRRKNARMRTRSRLARPYSACACRVCRADIGQQAERPSNEAPFECPIAGVPLNGSFRCVLHRPTGTLLSDKCLKQAPSAVRGVLLEAATAALDGGVVAADKDALTRVADAGGAWTDDDWVVVNPEGTDAETARHRVELVVARVRVRGRALYSVRLSANHARSRMRALALLARPPAAMTLSHLLSHCLALCVRACGGWSGP